MVVDDSEKRRAILQILYDQNVKDPGVPTSIHDLMRLTKTSSTEINRCIRYLKEKGLITVQHFFGGDFTATITASGIDTIEEHPSEVNGLMPTPIQTKSEEDAPHPSRESGYQYDAAISYAGENKSAALEIHAALEQRGITCYLALLKKGRLWGQKLDDVFENVFSKQARFVIILVSREYRGKRWTDFELSVALKETKGRHGEYVLPVRLDDTLFQGIPSTVAYLDYAEEGPDGIADALIEKLHEVNPSRGDSMPSQVIGKRLSKSRQSTESNAVTPSAGRLNENPALRGDVCSEGPFTIEPGGHLIVPLNLHKGDLLSGAMDEVDGDAFDWYIINEKNMVEFKKGNEFNYKKDGEGEGAYLLSKWKTPEGGPWYLILSARGKQNPREVSVRLRKQAPIIERLLR